MNTPTREIYWNISGHNLIYALFALALIFFVYGFYRRYRLWRKGGSERRLDRIGERFKSLIKDGLLQFSLLREKGPGLMHVAIYSGFVILFIGTLLVFLQADFSIDILFGRFYLWYSLILDLFGVIFILGILYAMVRRYLVRPDRLHRLVDDAVILPALLLIAVTGFLVEGARISATDPAWAAWSPVGFWISGWFQDSAAALHRPLWWGHMLISMAFIAYIPYSKLSHIFISPANLFFRSLETPGRLTGIDMETSESFGVSQIDEFTWKQLLDLDACTHCGRCQDRCPAYLSGKPLSPKKIILDLRDRMGGSSNGSSLVPEGVTEEELWACTTCLACQEFCPVAIEHVQKVVDLRRARVMMDSAFPSELNNTFRGLETNANPWNFGHASRADWLEGLDVPLISQKGSVELLWYVGCSGSFDDRGKAISRAMAEILNRAGLDYAVLGAEEKCCGDPARRAGNEYVFQMMAEENISIFNNYSFQRILTFCPHGYHMLKNEYPAFGGVYQVIHHSQLIEQLLANQRIRVKEGGDATLTYHDSCYLGRYNDLFQAPRQILARFGVIKEMEHSGRESLCCGAGGARMFLEETIGRRINHLRVEQAQRCGSSTMGVACPFCYTMLDDGVKELEIDGKMQVLDIAQIVAKNLE